MSPTTLSSSPSKQAAIRLAARQAELRALLRAAAGEAVGAAERGHEVLDFKDAAAEETQVVVQEAGITHATQELASIAEALRRVDDGTYGLCQDCGDEIDGARLRAMPATAYCTACQSVHERPGLRR